MNVEELKKHCEKQINLCSKLNDYKHLEEHQLVLNLIEENKQLKYNWNKLKEDVINDINFWEKQEKKWIELGFIKFGGEANNKIIFKKVLDKMQEIEGSDSNVKD